MMLLGQPCLAGMHVVKSLMALPLVTGIADFLVVMQASLASDLVVVGWCLS